MATRNTLRKSFAKNELFIDFINSSSPKNGLLEYSYSLIIRDTAGLFHGSFLEEYSWIDAGLCKILQPCHDSVPVFLISDTHPLF